MRCRHQGAKTVTLIDETLRTFFFEDDGSLGGDDVDTWPTAVAFVQCYQCGVEVRISTAKSGPKWARRAAELAWHPAPVQPDTPDNEETP